jgi:hypothetical protein
LVDVKYPSKKDAVIPAIRGEKCRNVLRGNDIRARQNPK